MDIAATIKPQPAAAAKKKPTTLLDAYEVECIRRELERLVLKHNHDHQRAAAAGVGDTAVAPPPNARVHRRRHDDGNQLHLHHQRVISSARTKAASARRASPSPLPPPAAPPGTKTKGRRGVPLLGRHVVAICSGTAPVAGSGAHVGGRGRRPVAICSGGGRRRPRGGFREVEKV